MAVVVTRFSADWCGPCKMFAPIFEEVEKSMINSGVQFKVVDIDKNRPLTESYRVRSIPTTIIEVDGRQVNSIPGIISKSQLENQIKNHVI